MKKLKPITKTKKENSSFKLSDVTWIEKDQFQFLFIKNGKYHFATLSIKEE